MYKNYKEVCNICRDCIVCPIGQLSFKKGNGDKTCQELFQILVNEGKQIKVEFKKEKEIKVIF